jgi:hypothetical protein
VKKLHVIERELTEKANLETHQLKQALKKNMLGDKNHLSAFAKKLDFKTASMI